MQLECKQIGKSDNVYVQHFRLQSNNYKQVIKDEVDSINFNS